MSSPNAGRKLSLALGGGAVLGAAHIGVLKVLEELEIKISAISGTSIGAFIAALYAYGKSADEIGTIVQDLNWLDITEFSLSSFGFLSNEALGDKITETLGEVTIEDAKIPVAFVATDIASGKKVILKEGDIATAVMASACVPGIFIPVEIDDQMLVDGGLVENVPISPLRELEADFIVGVDLNAKRNYQKPEDIIDVLANTLEIAIDNATRMQTDKADLLITPQLSAFSRTDASKTEALIDIGYKAAYAPLKDLSEGLTASEI